MPEMLFRFFPMSTEKRAELLSPLFELKDIRGFCGDTSRLHGEILYDGHGEVENKMNWPRWNIQDLPAFISAGAGAD